MGLRRSLLACALTCAYAVISAGTASAGVGFALAPGTPVAVDSGPNGIAAGDFNGDGKLDVAAVGDNVGTVVILLGDGHGSYTRTQTIAVGAGPESVAAGDFDENGTVDLAVASALTDSVEILAGDGAGHFTQTSTLPGIAGAWWITAADLNGDGHLDMAVSHVYADATHGPLGSEVSILLGDGHGGFSQSQVLQTGEVPYGIAVADLDGDGHPDLAVANQYAGSVSLFHGDGSGSFTPLGSPIAVPAGPSWVVARDLDGDGIPDLAVSSQGAGTITILHGDGVGGFTTASSLAAGSGTTPLLAFDVDGDGHVDLVSGNIRSNDVTVLAGDGHGGFGPATSFAAGTKPVALAAADADRDGRPDLVVGDYGAPSEVRTLLNTSSPFAPAPTALTGERLSSGFSPCNWSGSGPPPVDTCTATAPVVSASCDPSGTSTITIVRSGYADGPFPGTYTESLTATIGPQTGPAAPAFQPFADTGFQSGSDGFPTGLIESLTSHFTITTYDGTTTVTGDAHVVPDLANTGVCRTFDNEVTGSTVHGGALLTGYFYFLNAQRLAFDASIASGGTTTTVSSELESYLQNSYATYVDSTGALRVASATGSLLDGLGTTHPAYGTTSSAPTPAGTSVPTSPAAGVQLTFDQVTAAGQTSVTALTTVPPLPAGFSVGDPPLYYDISTTATFGGSIRVCAPYGAAPAGEQPQLLHYENGAWQNVTTDWNDATRVVCGSVSSLSPFAAAFAAPDTTPPTLTVPSALAVDATGPAGAVVTWTASAVDSGHPVPVTCAPPSGSTFAAGDTTVACTATDAAGNTARAGFGVHVRGAAEQLSRLQAAVAAAELGPAQPGIVQQVGLAARSLDRPHTACQALGTAATLLRTPAARGAAVAGTLADVTRIRAVLGC